MAIEKKVSRQVPLYTKMEFSTRVGAMVRSPGVLWCKTIKMHSTDILVYVIQRMAVVLQCEHCKQEGVKQCANTITFLFTMQELLI